MTYPTPSRSSVQLRPMQTVGCVAVLVIWCGVALQPVTAQADEQPATTQATAPASQSTPAEQIASEIVKVVGQNEGKVRREAAIAICRTGSQEGVAALTTVLTSQNNEAAKSAVCEAIVVTQWQPPELIDPLKALLSASNADLQRAAAAALAIYDDEQVAEALAVYRERRERALMVQAVRNLMEKLYQATTEQARRDALLLEWLGSDLAQQRLTAMNLIHEALRSTGTQPAEEVLARLRTMIDDRDETVRAKLVTFLRDLGTLEDAQRIAVRVVDEPSPTVRLEIYKALGKLADPATLDVCIAGLSDPERVVAAAAVEAIGRLCERGNGQPEPAVVAEAVQALIARYEASDEGNGADESDPEPVLRRSLIEAMAAIADPKVADLLAAHAGADESDPLVRQAALRGLGRVGEQSHLEIVVDRLVNDPEPVVRETAARVVGELGNEPAHLAALRTRLDRNVESSAAVASQAWEAYQALFQRMAAAEQEKILRSWEASSPDRMIALAARVKPEARDSAASFLLEHVTAMNRSDHAGAVAFVESLTKTVSDRFGPEWAERFDRACQPPTGTTKAADSQPAA